MARSRSPNASHGRRRGGRRVTRDGVQLLPTKEEIVFGDGSVAIDELGRRLREWPSGETTISVVRAWLDELVG